MIGKGSTDTYLDESAVRAIVAEAGDLTGDAAEGRQEDGVNRKILLRTTARTSAETVALLERFWQKLGFMPVFEPELRSTDLKP